MEGYHYIVKHGDMLFSQRYGESTDYCCKDVKNFSSSVEFVRFMDQLEETLVYDPPYHFPPRYKSCVKFVEDALKELPLPWFL